MRLPECQLDESGATGITLRFPVTSDADRHQLLDAAGGLSSLDPDFYLRPSSIDQQDDGINILFRESAGMEAPDVALRKRLRRAVVPSLLNLVEFQFRILSRWDRRQLLPPVPCLIRAFPGTGSPWRMIPVPTLSLTLESWAGSDAAVWSVLHPRSVLGGFDPDDSYLCAATLHSFLAGNHIHSDLPASHRFRRLLRNQIEPQPALGAMISQVLPATFEQEATELRNFVAGYLIDSSGRRSEAAGNFVSIVRNLSYGRLRDRWNREQQETVAQELTSESERLFGAAGAAELPAETADEETPSWSDDVPWSPDESYEDVPPSASPTQPPETGLPATLNHVLHQIPEEGHGAVRRFLGLVQHFAAMEEDSRETVTSAIALLRQVISSVPDERLLDESTDLQIAHINARYLGVDESKLSVLRVSMTSSWNQAVSFALRARLASNGKAYNQTSGLCRNGRSLIASMPEQGGAAGTYLAGYLHLLDGIAHIGGAGAYQNHGFFADSFDQLRQSYNAAQRIGSPFLTEAAIAWLRQLHRVTTPLSQTKSSTIHIGVSAFVSTLGIQTQSGDVTIPEIPWYEDSVIFPG